MTYIIYDGTEKTLPDTGVCINLRFCENQTFTLEEEHELVTHGCIGNNVISYKWVIHYGQTTQRYYRRLIIGDKWKYEE